MNKKTLRFLLFPVSAIAILLTTTLIAVNTITSKNEKEINQEWEQFSKQFPHQETNNTARQLEVLTAKLGFRLYQPGGFKQTAEQVTDLEPTTKDKQEFETIQESLKSYLDNLAKNSNQPAPALPQNLRRYLIIKAPILAEIRKLITNNQPPLWQMSLEGIGNIDYQLPSFLGQINLQRILALEILEKNRQRQYSEALQTLETSWKINQQLYQRYELIAQLVTIIISKSLIPVVRQLNNLPVQWQQRLLENDYRHSILTSLELEKFNSYFLISQSKPDELFPPFGENSSENNLLLTSFNPLVKPYLRLSAIDTYYSQKKSFSLISQQSFCSANSDKKPEEVQASWWNSLGQIAVPSFTNQFLKADKLMLDLELTQKILQVKTIAAKLGKWPDSLPNLQSKICPNTKWVYTVKPDNTMSLSLQEKIASQLPKDSLPLTYTAKFTQKP